LLASTFSTLLVLAPIGLPPYAARGARQTLKPINASKMQRRTVNGELLDLAPAQFTKYETEITCTDVDSPATDGVWPGLILTLDCVAELAYLTAGGTPQRPVVAGSSRVEGAFTYYRPQLVVMVTDWSIEENEWGRAVAWSIHAEEV
jgi:hypothetical protein